MLQASADRLAGSPVRRHLFLMAATIITISCTGYYFGTFDQSIHIPFLKKYANPALFPNDKFLDLRLQHYSYFWFLFQPFYHWGVLEAALFVTHCLATYATFWAVWSLSETLFHSRLAAVLTVLGFVFPHLGFAGFPVIEFSLLNRTFVLPFLLLAIILYLRQRYILAFGLLGLMYNLHVISVQFVLAMFLLDIMLEFKRVGWRHVAVGLPVFVVAALPVLVWKVQTSPVDLSLRPVWLNTIARGMFFNLFYLLAANSYILLSTLSGFSALALFVIAHRGTPTSPQHRTMSVFVIAAVLFLVVQAIASAWLPVTIIIQSQIVRAGIFILIFAYIYFAGYLARLYEARPKRFDFGALAGGYLLSLLAVAPLAIWGVQRLRRVERLRRWLAWGIVVAGLVGSFWIATVFKAWGPGLHIFGPSTAWEDTQVWARDHTAVEALFITPPQIYWLYQSDWRVFSERSTVATLSELLEAAFDPAYLTIWTPRFEAVAPRALAQFRGDVFENQQITAQAFYSLSSEDFVRLGQRFGASYLVVEKPHAYNLALVYENAGFRIYALPRASP